MDLNIEFYLRLHNLRSCRSLLYRRMKGNSHLSRPPPSPFWTGVAQRSPLDIETMEPVEPPRQAIEEWIPDDKPPLALYNRLRKPPNHDLDNFDQSRTWGAP